MRSLLWDVKVVEFTQYVAGPGMGQIFAELGADVVKVEPPGGELARRNGFFGECVIRQFNRGKRSVVVDLRRSEGRAIADKLVAGADVVVQNMRPGVAEALGFGIPDVARIRPDAIYISISGFGAYGPSRGRPGLDVAAQAESGLMSIVATGDGGPGRVATPIVDAACAHVAAEAALAALYARARTGEGSSIEISLLEVGIALQAVRWGEFSANGQQPETEPSTIVAPSAEVVATRDGHIVLSAYADEHWLRLCEAVDRCGVLRDERFSSSDARVRHRVELRAALRAALESYTTEEAVAVLSEAGVVVGRVRDYHDVKSSPDVVGSGIFTETTGPAEMCYEAVGLPYRIDGATRAPLAASVDAGHNTEEVLAELGFSAGEIEELMQGEVVGAHDRESGPAREEGNRGG
jgi:crotonobetainyl-CoA:carnitine CoA-transferase CaiB-like acyl-CoA transferase